MRESKVIGTISGLTAFAACAAIYFSTKGGTGPSFDATPHEATGLVIAQQALSLLKPGGQISIIARDTRAFKNPASDTQLASFQKALRNAGASIRTTLMLQVDPLRPVQVPASDFFELIRSSTPGSVIVSFMGPPLLTDAQRAQLGEIKPSIIAFCSGTIPELVDLRALFDQGLLHAAILAKHNKPAASPGDLRKCFDSSFVAITSANLTDLPVLPGPQ
jgi:hypothetical protein